MADPSLDDGFIEIPAGLLAAILTADIPNGDMIVLAEILTQSYGPAKRLDILIDPVDIETITSLHRNNVRRAVKNLIAANLIAKNDDGTHRFLKDWEQYKPGGKPFIERLGGRLSDFIRSFFPVADRRSELRSMPYVDYLRTPEWQAIRKIALQGAEYRCQVCNSPKRLDVHHRTYERRGHELPGDLTVLCRGCHGTFHRNGAVARTD